VRPSLSGCFFIATWAFASDLRAQTSADDEAHPPLTTTRHGEDYSYLADPSRRTGEWWEPLKHIPLGSDPETYLATGNELRLRQEVYRERLWGASEDPDDGYTWARALPYADLHIGPSARAFAQLGVAYIVGSSLPATPVEETGIDVAQAFLELSTSLSIAGTEGRLSVRGGRRQISFGSGRLIAPRYGPNVMQAFDGGFGTLAIGDKVRIDAFYAHPVAPGTGDFDDRTGDPSLWALYGVRRDLKTLGGRSAVDVYYIGYRDEQARFDQGRAPEERHTIGARVAGRSGNWDWDWEAMYQFGSFGEGDISAWSVGTRTAYSWKNLNFQPRLMLEADIISGDAHPADPDLQTFNALFPNGNFFGELTPIGPYNLITIGPSATATIAADIEVEVQTLFHWRESLRDGVYNVPGNLVRSAGTSKARRIGTQGSVSLTWAPARTFDLMASYGFFDAGAFLDETGASKTTHFLGLQARFRY
jgi:hypothetical protein